jgi:hypothetical protein
MLFCSFALGWPPHHSIVSTLTILDCSLTGGGAVQVLGNIKGVVATVVSVLMFKNVVSWAGCTGYAIAIAGVFLYSNQKQQKKEAAAASSSIIDSKLHGKGGVGFDRSSLGDSSDSELSPLITNASAGGKSSSTAFGEAEKLLRYSR